MANLTLDAGSEAIADEFKTQGYVIIDKLIPEELSDSVLLELEPTKARPSAIYYSQCVHRWVKPRLSPYSYWIDSVENPTRHIHLSGLRRTVMKILYHQRVSDALSSITGPASFISWQDIQLMQRTENPAIFCKGINEFSYVAKWHLKFFKDRLLNDRAPIANMIRDAYDR